MGYIGKQPTKVPLTSEDIVDESIESADIKDGTIVNSDINAAAAIAVSKLSTTGTANSSTFLRGDNAWTAVDALPSQSGNAGKFLTTNASTASWTTISTVFPFFKTDGSADNITITSGEFPFYKADGSADNIGVS